jgi:hypothetical protein
VARRRGCATRAASARRGGRRERAAELADLQLDLTAGYGINSNQNTYSEVYSHLKDTN